jgi:hypothetical protein
MPMPVRLRPLSALFAAMVVCAPFGSGARAAEVSSPSAQHKTTQSESYVIIEPLYASILDGARSHGLLLVELGLDVPDVKLRDKVNQSLPTLRDAYVRSLLTYAATSVRAWRQPSVEDIGTRMQAITDRVMGQTGARVLMAQTAIRLTR